MKKFNNNPIIVEALNFASEAQKNLDKLEYLATIKGTPEWFMKRYGMTLDEYYGKLNNDTLPGTGEYIKYIIYSETQSYEGSIEELADMFGVSYRCMYFRIRQHYFENKGFEVERVQ